MRALKFASCLLPVVLLGTGCDFDHVAASERFREDFRYTYDLKPGGTVTLQNMNGSVDILGWEKQSVEIRGTKYARTPEELESTKIEVESKDGQVSIRTVAPKPPRGAGAKYVIRVPMQTNLDSIASSNGGMRVEDVEGTVRLATSNGAVRVRRLVGPLNIKTSNGTIEIHNLNGDADLSTSNATIDIDQAVGRIEGTTSNASINLALIKPAPNKPLVLRTSNGSIKIALNELEGNDIRADTSNASITVRLPESANARLRASTSNAAIHSEVDVKPSGSVRKGSLEGEIGSGGPLIQLSTSNAGINVLKL